MRQLVIASVILGLSCGGGSSKKDAAPVDPASQDFCLEYANAICRLAYLCTDAASQNDAFRARYGRSMDDCWQGIDNLCTSNQTGATAFGPSCGPGKTVNTALAMACNDSLDSTSCVAWQAAPSGAACQTVCNAAGGTNGAGGAATGSGGSATGSGGAGTGAGGMRAGAGGAGTSTGGAGTSSGGSGGSGAAAKTAFCTMDGTLSCDRVFECDPQGGAVVFGSLDACKAVVAEACAANDPCPVSFDATQGAACIAATQAATCAQLMGAAPAACTQACQ